MDYKQTLASLEPLLRSNVAPLPQQISNVTSVISHFAEQLDGVESRIARLRDELSQLESTKTALREEIARYSSILSPVRSIPPEIIRTIMLHCYDEESFDERQVQNMALVSRRWYEVAVSTPLLWSAYTIDTTDTPAIDGSEDPVAVAATIVSQASVHLSKALSRPVSLGLYLNASQLPGDAIFDFVRNLAPRLGRFHISLGARKEKGLDSTLTKLLGKTFVWPAMWDLDINLRMEDSSYVNRWCGDVFTGPSSRFPAVRRVQLKKRGEGRMHTYGENRLQGWDMPWSQLSHLSLGPLPMCAQDILNILHSCTNLQETVISIIGSGSLSSSIDDTTDPTKPIELSKLRCLHLATEDVQVSEYVLDRLSLPVLEKFIHGLDHKTGFGTPVVTHVTREYEEIDCILKPLVGMFQRSECSETLNDLQLDLAAGLDAVDYITENIEELFATVPRLKRFKITGFRNLPRVLLNNLPLSVDHLEVEVKTFALDYTREKVAEFLVDHCRARQLANNGIPQEMNATLRIWTETRDEMGKQLVRSLQLAQGDYESAAKLTVDMD